MHIPSRTSPASAAMTISMWKVNAGYPLRRWKWRAKRCYRATRPTNTDPLRRNRTTQTTVCGQVRRDQPGGVRLKKPPQGPVFDQSRAGRGGDRRVAALLLLRVRHELLLLLDRRREALHLLQGQLNLLHEQLVLLQDARVNNLQHEQPGLLLHDRLEMLEERLQLLLHGRLKLLREELRLRREPAKLQGGLLLRLPRRRGEGCQGGRPQAGAGGG